MLNLKTKQHYLPIRDGKFLIRGTGHFSIITENKIKEWWQDHKVIMGEWSDEEFAIQFSDLLSKKINYSTVTNTSDIVQTKCQVIMRSSGSDPELVQLEAILVANNKILSRRLITISDCGKDIFLFNLPCYAG